MGFGNIDEIGETAFPNAMSPFCRSYKFLTPFFEGGFGGSRGDGVIGDIIRDEATVGILDRGVTLVATGRGSKLPNTGILLCTIIHFCMLY